MALLGGIVFLRNPKSAMGRLFLAVCLSMAVWVITHYIVDHAQNESGSLVAAQASAAAAFNIVFWNLLFSYKFKSTSPGWLDWKSISLGWILGSIFSFSPLVYNSASQGQSVMNIGHGSGYWVYMGIIVLLLSASLWTLIAAKRVAETAVRSQINYILLAFVVTFGVAIINNGIIPIFVSDWRAVKYTSILAVFFVAIVSYAIIKHRLFDIRFIVARTIAYTLLLSILTIMYAGSLFGLGLIFNRAGTSVEQVVINTALAIVVAATFQPLKKWLEIATNKVFYKGDYSSEQLISNITAIMAETLQLSRLTRASIKMLVNTMHIEYGSFWVVENNKLVCITREGEKSNQQPAGIRPEVLELLRHNEHEIVIDEDEDEEHRQLLHQLNASVVILLSAGESLQGILALGPKKSGVMYSNKDLNVLKIIGPGLATALENARSYKQISEFNVTLEHEVDKATTDLKKANEKLSRSNEKLRQLDQLKDEFISVTSHELRTPLTAIRGYIWMAMNGKNKDKSYTDYMTRAYASTERLITMVNDTLDVSRIESGRMTLAPEPTNIIALTQEAVANLSAKAFQQKQTVTVKKVKLLPLVECDSDKIYQVLVNLIGNAIKFTPRGGEIKIDFKHRGDDVIVQVKDNGPGISRENQKRLFQKFSRLENNTSIPGTGLGLYLCRQIIERSGGKIWIESDVGKGAAFLFALRASNSQQPVTTRRPQQFRNIGSV